MVGCGESAEEKAAKAKAEAAAEAKATAEAKTAAAAKAAAEANAQAAIEAAVRKAAKKPPGELTKADFEMVTELWLYNNQLTDVKELEKLTQLTKLNLSYSRLNWHRILCGLKNVKYHLFSAFIDALGNPG